MKRKDKIITVVYFAVVAITIIILIWSTSIPSKAQTIEAVLGQLIKVYETEWPYEKLSDEARLYVRICFMENVYEYGNDCNSINDFFRLAFADDMRFNQVVLLVAYLNSQRNQLTFFYIYEDWLAQTKPIL